MPESITVGSCSVSDEAILEAVVQIMELNGCGRDSGWELRLTLERAQETEAILRAMIDGSILENIDD